MTNWRSHPPTIVLKGIRLCRPGAGRGLAADPPELPVRRVAAVEAKYVRPDRRHARPTNLRERLKPSWIHASGEKRGVHERAGEWRPLKTLRWEVGGWIRIKERQPERYLADWPQPPGSERSPGHDRPVRPRPWRRCLGQALRLRVL